MMPHRKPARPGEPGAGQAGIRAPVKKANLARSARANQFASHSVTPSSGSPTSAKNSPPAPKPSPKVTMKMATNPSSRPARCWAMASQVRGDTRSRRRNMALTL